MRFRYQEWPAQRSVIGVVPAELVGSELVFFTELPSAVDPGSENGEFHSFLICVYISISGHIGQWGKLD